MRMLHRNTVLIMLSNHCFDYARTLILRCQVWNSLNGISWIMCDQHHISGVMGGGIDMDEGCFVAWIGLGRLVAIYRYKIPVVKHEK